MTASAPGRLLETHFFQHHPFPVQYNLSSSHNDFPTWFVIGLAVSHTITPRRTQFVTASLPRWLFETSLVHLCFSVSPLRPHGYLCWLSLSTSAICWIETRFIARVKEVRTRQPLRVCRTKWVCTPWGTLLQEMLDPGIYSVGMYTDIMGVYFAEVKADLLTQLQIVLWLSCRASLVRSSGSFTEQLGSQHDHFSQTYSTFIV